MKSLSTENGSTVRSNPGPHLVVPELKREVFLACSIRVPSSRHPPTSRHFSLLKLTRRTDPLNQIHPGQSALEHGMGHAQWPPWQGGMPLRRRSKTRSYRIGLGVSSSVKDLGRRTQIGSNRCRRLWVYQPSRVFMWTRTIALVHSFPQPAFSSIPSEPWSERGERYPERRHAKPCRGSVVLARSDFAGRNLNQEPITL